METKSENANRALQEAERGVVAAEKIIEAARARMAVLELQLDRARATVVIKRRERDEIAMDEVVGNAPQLTDLQKKAAALRL